MNFIFISPNFPENYWKFCESLRINGVNVLGIGDQPYEALSYECKHALQEYYYVKDMNDYEQLFKAVAFFSYKYGKIDWLESNNEYWMRYDAKLRTDFHITSGYQENEVEMVRNKALMKKGYLKAHIKSARQIEVQSYPQVKDFVQKCGYPCIAKPKDGVGAFQTYRLNCEEDVEEFMKQPHENYVMEEFIEGTIVTYDGIVDSKGTVILETSHVFPVGIMEIVNQKSHLAYYSEREIPSDLRKAGKAVLKAFKAKGRWFHLEFFRLAHDKEGMGKKNDLIGLEVNMRVPGGYTADMIDYANEIDAYQIWADMVCGYGARALKKAPYYGVYASQKYHRHYCHHTKDILQMYGSHIRMHEYLPEIWQDAMGDETFIACFETMDEVHAFIDYVQKEETV